MKSKVNCMLAVGLSMQTCNDGVAKGLDKPSPFNALRIDVRITFVSCYTSL